jgi:hypothetical protein
MKTTRREFRGTSGVALSATLFPSPEASRCSRTGASSVAGRACMPFFRKTGISDTDLDALAACLALRRR